MEQTLTEFEMRGGWFTIQVDEEADKHKVSPRTVIKSWCEAQGDLDELDKVKKFYRLGQLVLQNYSYSISSDLFLNRPHNVAGCISIETVTARGKQVSKFLFFIPLFSDFDDHKLRAYHTLAEMTESETLVLNLKGGTVWIDRLSESAYALLCWPMLKGQNSFIGFHLSVWLAMLELEIRYRREFQVVRY